MSNEEIIRQFPYVLTMGDVPELLDLARADEREKITQEKFAEYFNSLKGGEVASFILTQLLRRGVTDDDLRGLRLQWIKDEREKLQGVEVWVSSNSDGSSKYLSLNAPDVRNNNSGVWYDYSKYFNGVLMLPTDKFKLFNISVGQCERFRIVRVVE